MNLGEKPLRQCRVNSEVSPKYGICLNFSQDLENILKIYHKQDCRISRVPYRKGHKRALLEGLDNPGLDINYKHKWIIIGGFVLEEIQKCHFGKVPIK